MRPDKKQPRSAVERPTFAEGWQQRIDQHLSAVIDRLTRLAQYYQTRAEFYASEKARNVAKAVEQQLREGKVRLGGVIDRFLREEGIRTEGATVSAGHNEAFLNFLIGMTMHHLASDPKVTTDQVERFLKFESLIRTTVSDAAKRFADHNALYEKLWKDLESTANMHRDAGKAHNMAVAEGLAWDYLKYGPDEVKGWLREMFKARNEAHRAQWLGLVGMWQIIHRGNFSESLRHLQSYFDAHRRVQNVWRRTLEAEITELHLRSEALKRLSPREVATLTEKELRRLVEEEWRRQGNEGSFYAYKEKLQRELESSRRTAHKKMLTFLNATIHDLHAANPSIFRNEEVEALSSFVQSTLTAMDKEVRAAARLRMLKARGADPSRIAEAEHEYEVWRRFRGQLKELAGFIGATYIIKGLAPDRTPPIPTIHFNTAVQEIQDALKQADLNTLKSWRWLYQTPLGEFAKGVLFRGGRWKTAKEMADLIRKYPDAPESVIKFLARVNTQGAEYQELVRDLKDVSGSLKAKRPIPHILLADVLHII
mgnify:CR=1 FL=1